MWLRSVQGSLLRVGYHCALPLWSYWLHTSDAVLYCRECLQLRQRYRAIYQNFRPGCCFWGLVLLTRKLLFAAISTMLNHRVALAVRGTNGGGWKGWMEFHCRKFWEVCVWGGGRTARPCSLCVCGGGGVSSTRCERLPTPWHPTGEDPFGSTRNPRRCHQHPRPCTTTRCCLPRTCVTPPPPPPSLTNLAWTLSLRPPPLTNLAWT